MSISDLIASLSQETPKPRLKPPGYFAARLGAVLTVYGIGIQFFLELRTDLLAQFSRPMFTLEILLLVLLTVCSATAALLAMYPDVYQKPRLLNVPYAVFMALVAFMLVQFLLPHDIRMVIPPLDGQAMECAICIASVALLPSALIFALLRKGASVYPWRAGSFAMLAASGIGCLTLRLAEANDSLLHLAVWHYLPTLFFAGLGAVIGRLVLRW
jgi:hypothetical protein